MYKDGNLFMKRHIDDEERTLTYQGSFKINKLDMDIRHIEQGRAIDQGIIL